MPGIGDIIGGVGALGNFFTGRSAQNASKENQRRQAQFAQMQNQTYQQVNPLYLQAVQQYAQQLGIGGPAGSPGVSSSQPGRFQLGSLQQAQGGQAPYGTPQDHLRLRQAEEGINRYAQGQANQLQHTLGQRGVPQEILAAAQARNQAGAQSQYAQFARQQAINAPLEQERKMQTLLAMLGPGLGAGGQAASIYGAQGAQQQAQANSAYGGIGDILQQWQYQNALSGYGQQQGGGGGGPFLGGMENYGSNTYGQNQITPDILQYLMRSSRG